jgi:SAM-dependent methyltransferase
MRSLATLLCLASATACAHRQPAQGTGPQGRATSTVGVALIQRDAKNLERFVETELARAFLRAAQDLPHVPTRTVRWSGADHVVDEEAYYNPPHYGTVPAYARPLDLLAKSMGERAPATMAGWRILDFGYGAVGHMRIFALLGAEAVGVDVDPMLPALYAEPGDQGAVGGGRITLLDGEFPKDAKIAEAAGGGYDLIISKNTLKKGYVHPDQPDPKHSPIDLGESDEAFLGEIHARLKPQGFFLIYNICPAQRPAGYLPMADGRSPFSKEQLEKAGLEVIAFDRDDTKPVQEMARILGWDRGDEKIDIEKDLLAIYTLARRR